MAGFGSALTRGGTRWLAGDSDEGDACADTLSSFELESLCACWQLEAGVNLQQKR